jgi:alpha-1,3-fucosyltransferase
MINKIIKNELKVRKRIFSIFIVLILLLVIFYSLKIDRNIEFDWVNNIAKIKYKNRISHFNSLETCSPINVNPQDQFSISINNRTYPFRIPLYFNNSINLKCLNSSQTTKTILLWNEFVYYPPIINYGEGERIPFIKNNCPVTSCLITSNRTKLNQSDAILIHMRSSIDKLPEWRSESQRWIKVIFESQWHCEMCFKYVNIFNLTASHLDESDFTSVYVTDSGIKWEPNDDYIENFDYYSTKTGLAAALISYCLAVSDRLKFIGMLKKHMPVDVYGNCGKPCPKGVNCREMIASKYKFLLAFENSFCRDYITEKFFDTLKYNVVPVVLGSGDYVKHIPKSGYIDVRDFNSSKTLADYLKYLDNNKTAYNEYFNWKKYVKFDKNPPLAGYICEICIQLHLEAAFGIKMKTITDDAEKFNPYSNCDSSTRIYV